MDLNRVLRDLYEEKKRLDQIIGSLEHMQRAQGEKQTQDGRRPGRKGMDAQARLEVSRRMKEYWATRRKGADGAGPPATNGSTELAS